MEWLRWAEKATERRAAMQVGKAQDTTSPPLTKQLIRLTYSVLDCPDPRHSRNLELNTHIYTSADACTCYVCMAPGQGTDTPWPRAGPTQHRPTAIYLRPKRNSRIYFTYALLSLYFQLRDRIAHSP